MTITRNTLTAKPPMTALRKTALVAGGLYLITFLSSIPALLLERGPLANPDFILGAGSDTGVLLGSVLDLVNALAAIGTAVALFPVVKRQHEGVALAFVTSRLLEAAVVFAGIASLFSLVSMRHDLASAPGADSTSIVVTGRSLVAFHDWTFLIGPGLIPGFNALLLGYLMYRSGLVPRIIPTIGLIGAPLLIASATATMFGVFDQVSPVAMLLGLPVATWELSVGCWMFFKGFKPSPITADTTTPDTTPVYEGAVA